MHVSDVCLTYFYYEGNYAVRTFTPSRYAGSHLTSLRRFVLPAPLGLSILILLAKETCLGC